MQFKTEAPRPRSAHHAPNYPRCLGAALVALAISGCDKPTADPPPPQLGGAVAPDSFETVTSGSAAPPFSGAVPSPTEKPHGSAEPAALGSPPVPFEPDASH